MWFKKLADSVYHGLNPFDGGQGWTSRAPARRPQPTRKPTSFAEEYRQRNNTAFAGNRYAQQQQQQQQPQGPQYKAPESNERSFLEKIMDQANIFDNNRTYKQATPTQSKSSFQQLGQAGGQVSRNMFPATLQTINSTGEFLGDTVDLGRVGVARATGNKQAERAALNRGLASRYSAPGQGLFGVGGLITSEQAQKPIAPSDLTKKIVGKGIEAYTEGKGLKMGGFVGKELLDQGVKQGFKSQLPNIGKNYLLNTVQGGVSAYNAGGSKEDIMKNALLSGPLGTVTDVGLGVGFAGIKSKIKPAAADGLGKSKVAFKGAAEASDEPAYLRNRPNTVEGKRLQQQKGVEIPMGKKKMSPAERAYRQAQPTNEQPAFMRGPEAESAQALVNQQRYNQALQAFDDSTLGVPQGAPNGRPRVQLQEMPTEAPRKQTPLEVADAQAGIRPLDPETVGAAKRIVDAPNTQKLQAEIDAIDARAVAERRPLTDTEQVRVALNLEKMGKAPKSNKLKGKKAKVVEKVDNLYKDAAGERVKTPGRARRMAESARGIISEYGTIGKDIAQRMGRQRDEAEQGLAVFYNSIPTVVKLKKEFVDFVDALEARSNGEFTPVSPKVQQAIDEWTAAIPSIRARAEAVGIDVGDLGPYYFPRTYSDDVAKRLLFTPQGIYDNFGQYNPDGIHISGHLNKSRLADNPNYERTPEAMINYLDGAMDSITKAEQFGVKSERLVDARNQLAANGNDPKWFDKAVNIALRNTDTDTAGYKASAYARQFNAWTSLSAASISNATQSLNTMTRAGIWRTLKGGYKILTSKEARDAIVHTGVTLDHAINDVAEGALGTGGKITANIASPLFRTVEKFNRRVAATVGADYATHLMGKARNGDAKAMAELTDVFGITGKIGDELTDAQLTQVARKMTEISQFKVDPQDLPMWVDSPMGKLAAQFRTFGYKQTNFMWNEVLRRAIIEKNYVPLARFIAMGAPAGLAAAKTRDLVRLKGVGQEKEEDGTPKWQQYGTDALQGISQVGGFGLAGSGFQSVKAGADYDDMTGSMVSLVGGPTAGLVVETGNNLRKLEKDGNWKPLAKEATRKIPLVGPGLANLASAQKFPGGGKGPLASDYVAPAKPGSPTEKKALENKNSPEAKEATDKMKKELELAPDKVGVQQLPNGQYAYTVEGIVKYTSDIKTANKELAMEDLKNSDEQSKIVGDKYYYKDENGDVKGIPKYRHEFDVVDSQNQLDMYIAKDNEDYASWTKSANSQLKALETLRDKYNKDSQEDKVDDIQKRIEQLKHDMAKYASYGGAFTKGRSGRGGGGGGGSRGAGETANIGKYSVDLNFGGRPSPVKVAAKTTSHKSGGGGGSGGGGKPKVSIKKSMV